MMVRCKLYPISLCNAGQDKHRFHHGKVIANTNPRPPPRWKVSERRQAFHKVIFKSLGDKMIPVDQNTLDYLCVT